MQLIQWLRLLPTHRHSLAASILLALNVFKIFNADYTNKDSHHYACAKFFRAKRNFAFVEIRFYELLKHRIGTLSRHGCHHYHPPSTMAY